MQIINSTLKTIGSTRRGAFAVASDGYGSYYTYCYDGNCLSSALTQDALTSCKSVTGKECLLMAFGRNEQIEFTVVSRRTELKSDDAILANILDANRLKTLIVGNTMQGEYINHKKWMSIMRRMGRSVARPTSSALSKAPTS